MLAVIKGFHCPYLGGTFDAKRLLSHFLSSSLALSLLMNNFEVPNPEVCPNVPLFDQIRHAKLKSCIPVMVLLLCSMGEIGIRLRYFKR